MWRMKKKNLCDDYMRSLDSDSKEEFNRDKPQYP